MRVCLCYILHAAVLKLCCSTMYYMLIVVKIHITGLSLKRLNNKVEETTRIIHGVDNVGFNTYYITSYYTVTGLKSGTTFK